MTIKGIPGLTAQIKNKLIQQALERRIKASAQESESLLPQALKADLNIAEQHSQFHLHPGYQQLRIINEGATKLGISNPFFKLHEGVAGASTRIEGKTHINYASYNYLGLSGRQEINDATKAAIDRYGTSASASRIVAGERPIHRELEQAIAQLYAVDDAIVFVSGHATNVTAIGYLFGPKDLIVHDELIHNSILQGIQLSGAKRLSFPHNDSQALDKLLTTHRPHYERVLICLEGIYSMDGDFPDLPCFIELKQKHKVFLMVDEAHSLGVMGETGLGIRQHFKLAGNAVDIWMGTLSKTLAGCGGYIAGESALIEHLKFLAPGFLYSVGISPPLAAASLAALQCLQAEPQLVSTLQARGQYFLQQAKAAGINTGTSIGLAIIPAIIGGSIKTARLSSALFERQINVQPILYPAVAEKSARLRFFISCEHTTAQIDHTIQVVAEEIGRL
jgi:8-amino-7-oxononanoate synthase